MPASHATHPNVVPLIDIIMCLIIFYMLVARIGVTTGADKSIAVPVTQMGIPLKDLGSTLLVNVREIGDPAVLQVTALAEGSGGKPVELRLNAPGGRNELLDELRKWRFGHDGKPGGTGRASDMPDFKLIIRGDQTLTYGALEPILLAAMQAQVRTVNFQTRKPS
jgi:biopolymer transport protein ExbD